MRVGQRNQPQLKKEMPFLRITKRESSDLGTYETLNQKRKGSEPSLSLSQCHQMRLEGTSLELVSKQLAADRS